jgi:broad specificity phosphatase PhoE
VERIFLVRHGKVDIDQSESIAGRTLSSFVDRYDNAGIVTSMLLPQRVLEIGRTANLIVCSDRRRALESAALMAPDANILSGAEFREAGLPTAFRTGIRLRADLWMTVARAAWFVGWAPECETIDTVKIRAMRAAVNLLHLASKRGSVVLVGHGLFNRYIASCLRREGFVGPRLISTRPWGVAQFRREPLANQ